MNLITPFKHEFAELAPGSKYEYQKDELGQNVYLRQGTFEQYEDFFRSERNEYSNLYDGIHKFEVIYKSLVVNLFMVKHNIINLNVALTTLEIYQDRINNLRIYNKNGIKETATRKKRMRRVYDDLIKHLKGFDKQSATTLSNREVISNTNIYLVMDRLTLSEINTVYLCMKTVDRIKIYQELVEFGVNLGSKNYIDLQKRVFNLVSIRNVIMHFNSITILLKYSDYKNKIYRTRNSIEYYQSIIRSIRYINKNISLI
jgi:hypothetical protein